MVIFPPMPRLAQNAAFAPSKHHDTHAVCSILNALAAPLGHSLAVRHTMGIVDWPPNVRSVAFVGPINLQINNYISLL